MKRDQEDLFKRSRRYPVQKLLRKIPGFGPLRAAFAIAVIGTPHRFRTKRQLWSYSGLAVLVHTSSDHELIMGRIVRKQRRQATRGLTHDYNRILKMVFKGAAKEAIRRDPIKTLYRIKVDSGIRPEMALLSIARRLASVLLVIWKRGEQFDVAKLICFK